MKDAQIEEERSRSLEHLKTIVQLREGLKQEQAKTAEMGKKNADLENKVNELVTLEAKELAKKNTEFEEAKNQSLAQLKLIEQLKDELKQEQAKLAEMERKASESATLDARVRELSNAIIKITEIAAAAKAV
ncbi:MAG: hypothetical protein PHY62_08765 [Gallionella sp.]|nr:hypothetical protein [Gallionella sp.]